MTGDNLAVKLGITAAEYQQILQLKANVKEILPEKLLAQSYEDQFLYLVRWIRARDHDLEKATNMLRNHLIWRAARNADDALTKEPHPFFLQNYPFSFTGVDRLGHPIMCVPFNEWDFREVTRHTERLAEFEGFLVYFFEKILHKISFENAMRPSGHPPITQITFIADLKNYSYGQLIQYSAIKKIAEVAGVFEAHYPEVCHKVFWINCPSYVGLLSNIVRPMVPAKVMKKVKYYSSMRKWQAEMNDIIDPAIISTRYGGLLK